MACYNRRGGAEVEQFRNDKNGLHLAARRKRGLLAQKSLILLTDLAHNFGSLSNYVVNRKLIKPAV
jgi:hypothetical protein